MFLPPRVSAFVLPIGTQTNSARVCGILNYILYKNSINFANNVDEKICLYENKILNFLEKNVLIEMNYTKNLIQNIMKLFNKEFQNKNKKIFSNFILYY